MDLINLQKPHGFLIWQSKQVAIASDKPFPPETPLYITSDGEAFGTAILGQPAQMTIPEFEREEWAEKHCIRPEERKLFWPEAQTLYVQTIKEFTGFKEPWPVINGQVKEYIPTRKEAEIIEQSQKLPKLITLEDEAVCLTNGGFTAIGQARVNEELKGILSVVYGENPRFLDQKRNTAMPLYSLALVRQPNLRFDRILSRVLSAEKQHTGVMVAFMLSPEDAKKLALSLASLPEGSQAVPAEELHLTLIYLGDSGKLEGRELIERVLSVFAEEGRPLTGKIGGFGRFMTNEDDGTNALYASFDSGDLPGFRQKLVDRLAGAGVRSDSAHGFTPHVTLAYIPQGVPMDNLDLPDLEMTFSGLTLAWGDEHITYPLSGLKKKSAGLPSLSVEATMLIEEELPGQEVVNKKQGSLQEKLERIRSGFSAQYGNDYGDPWVIDIFENYIIIDWEGTRYQVPFTEAEGRIIFVPRFEWLPVTVAYLPKAVGEKALTKTENGMEFSRSAYLHAPGDKVSDWKLRIEAEPGQITKNQLGAAAAALSPGGFRGQQVDLTTEEKRTAARKLIAEYRKLDVPDEDIPDHLWATADMTPSASSGPANPSTSSGKEGRRMGGGMLGKLKDALCALQELLGWAEYAEAEPELEPMMIMDLLNSDSGFAAKMVNGEPWHFAWATNSFQDRDGEIFSQKALETYVEENEKNEVKGWFNFWHIPETDYAEKRWQGIVHKWLIEAGPYLKNEKGQAALKFFSEFPNSHPDIAPEGWGSSPEYRYLPEERKSGVYQWVWITRTSTLPRGAAANIWTKSGQETVMLTGDRKKAAIALFGEAFVNNLIAEGERQASALDAAGVASKERNQDDKASKVGSFLKKKRTAMGWSEEAAAEKAGLEVADLVAIEAGDKMPDSAMLEALARLYEVSLDDLAELMPEGEMQKSSTGSDQANPELVEGKVDPAQAMDQLTEAVAARLLTNLNPLAEILVPRLLADLGPLTEAVQGVQAEVKNLGDRIGKVEGDQALKAKTELPRHVFQLMRASEAIAAQVPEGDALKDKKPEEKQPALKDGSMASAYFPGRK